MKGVLCCCRRSCTRCPVAAMIRHCLAGFCRWWLIPRNGLRCRVRWGSGLSPGSTRRRRRSFCRWGGCRSRWLRRWRLVWYGSGSWGRIYRWLMCHRTSCLRRRIRGRYCRLRQRLAAGCRYFGRSSCFAIWLRCRYTCFDRRYLIFRGWILSWCIARSARCPIGCSYCKHSRGFRCWDFVRYNWRPSSPIVRCWGRSCTWRTNCRR